MTTRFDGSSAIVSPLQALSYLFILDWLQQVFLVHQVDSDYDLVTTNMGTCKEVCSRFGFSQQFGFLVCEPSTTLGEYFQPWVDLVDSLDNIRRDPSRSIQEEVREAW